MVVSIMQAQLFFLAFTRIMAVLIHVPVLGGQTIPNQYRIAFGGLLCIVLVPWQPLAADVVELGLFGLAASILREILVGTLAGFAVSLTFGAVQIAGEAMDLGSGFSSGRLFNPAMGDSGSAYKQLFVIIATLFFLVLNGHHVTLLALQRTFDVVPLNAVVLPDSPEALLRLSSQLIVAGIQLALPIMCALLLTDITLGLLARVAPQVQVYFLGLPLKVGVALIALALLIMTILPLLENLYTSVGQRMLLLLGK